MSTFACDYAQYQLTPLESGGHSFPTFPSLDDFLAAQRQWTLDAYNGVLPGHSQVVAFQGLESVHDVIDYPRRDTALFGQVGRVRTDNFFVTQTAGDFPRIWARSRYRSYRQTFVRTLGALGVPLGAGSGLDVDHIAAKSSVGTRTVVALGLVDSSINQEWGNLVERLEVAYNRGRTRTNRDLSHGRAAKLLGIAPPRTPAGPIPVRESAWAEELARALTLKGGAGVTATAVRDWTLPFLKAKNATPWSK